MSVWICVGDYEQFLQFLHLDEGCMLLLRNANFLFLLNNHFQWHWLRHINVLFCVKLSQTLIKQTPCLEMQHMHTRPPTVVLHVISNG